MKVTYSVTWPDLGQLHTYIIVGKSGEISIASQKLLGDVYIEACQQPWIHQGVCSNLCIRAT